MLRHALPIMLAAALLVPGCTREVRDTWAPGVPKRSGQVVDGKQSGTWTYNDRQGRPVASGMWLDDFQHGPWTWWHPNGQVRAQGGYNLGLKTGIWRQFHPGGAPASEGAWQRDRQTGLWRYGDAAGRLFALGWYDRGLREGVWSWFHPDGTLKECGSYIHGVRVGPWIRRPLGGATVVDDLGMPAAWSAKSEPADGGGTWWSAIAPELGARAAIRIRYAADGLPLVATAAVAGELAVMGWGAGGRALATGTEEAGSAAGVWLHWVDGAERRIPWPASHAPPSAGQLADLARLRRDREPAVVEADRSVAESGHSMSVQALDILPVVQPTAPAQVEQPAAAATADAPEATPAPTLPNFWTAAQEASAGRVIATATAGTYPDAAPPTDAGKGLRELIGKPLPQTRFLAPTGSVLDLASYRGKAVALVVMRGFSGQVCLYCAAQTAALSNAINDFRGAGGEVVVVYPGPVESVPAFVEAVQSLRKDPPPMPLALDASLLAVRTLGIQGNLARPTTLVLDADGIVRWAYVGESIGDRPSAETVLAVVRRVAAAK